MTEFLSVLALYYLCDATARVREMSTQERYACFSTYEAVKSHFIEESDLASVSTVERARQLHAAYVAFQEWEAANPDLVRQMRDEARARASG